MVSAPRNVLDLVVVVEGDEPAAQLLVEFESEIFLERGFGDTHAYDDLLPQSRFVSGYLDGELVGVSRLVSAGPVPQPFVHEYPDVLRNRVFLDAVAAGPIHEVATLAVAGGLRAGPVTFDLIRHVYADGVRRGAANFAWIMEPERAAQLDRRFGLATTQMSDAHYYMGGNCAVFLMRADSGIRLGTRAGHWRDWFLEPLVTLTA